MAEGRIERRFAGNFVANNGETPLALVPKGLGIARLSAFMAAPAIREGRLVPVLTDVVRDTSPAISVTICVNRRLRLTLDWSGLLVPDDRAERS